MRGGLGAYGSEGGERETTSGRSRATVSRKLVSSLRRDQRMKKMSLPRFTAAINAGNNNQHHPPKTPPGPRVNANKAIKNPWRNINASHGNTMTKTNVFTTAIVVFFVVSPIHMPNQATASKSATKFTALAARLAIWLWIKLKPGPAL